MKRLSEFESLDDFGFKAVPTTRGKVEFIRCDKDISKVSIGDPSLVYTNGDITTGKFFTLEEIISGGSITVDLADTLKDQAGLALDYNLATSLAFLGSVYSTVMISINRIRDTYPNGFQILSCAVSPNVVIFNNSDTYMYGSPPFSIRDYTGYELVQAYNGAYNATFAINSQTSLTGGTYSVLFLDGTPTTGTGYTHMVQPTSKTMDKYYGPLNTYERNLLSPPHDRTNYFPHDTSAPRNVFFEGAAYDTFVEVELEWAALADEDEANFVWRKLYPDGQKNLDSDDGIMQKMVLVLAANFDSIKRYQDQLKYQQTIGYTTSNHVSKDLVENLASQWNWDLGHNLNQSDYSEHIYSQYENYVTGQSQQKISAKDVNFEMYRRVLSNLVTLYKKKGTRDAIMYVANMYGLPEALFWIEELVNGLQYESGAKPELMVSESNIVVPMSGQQYYVDEAGVGKVLPYRVVGNTKYLSIHISPFDAIEFDFYDWGWESHPDIIGVNGVSVALSSATQPTKAEFFNTVISNTVKSDGSARYDFDYPLLRAEAEYYLTGSVNQFTLSTLEPYMDFLDDNWNVLMSNLVPASSKLLSVGNLYRNPMWHREKVQWNDSELDVRALPFNETVPIPPFVPVVTVNTTKTGAIVVPDPSVVISPKPHATIEVPAVTSSKQLSLTINTEAFIETGKSYDRMFGHVQMSDPLGELFPVVEDGDTVTYTQSASGYSIGSPILEPISGQYGTSAFTVYDAAALVVSNLNNFNVIYSAYNLSDSGYTKIEFELYEKSQEESVVVDDNFEYSIMAVENEEATHGAYRISSVAMLDVLDFIKIQSDYLPYLNETVQITHIDSGNSTIRTTPKIGLFSLPIGVNNARVDWFDFINSDAVSMMAQLESFGISTTQQFTVIKEIVEFVDGGNLSDMSSIAAAMAAINQPKDIVNLFSWFWNQNAGVLYGCLLVLDFVNGNSTWKLSSPMYALVDKVASSQTKATFKRIINFFNWQSPNQTIVYANYAEGATMGPARDFTFLKNDLTQAYTLTFDAPTSQMSFSAATNSIHLALDMGVASSGVSHVIDNSWIPFKLNVFLHPSLDGTYHVTGWTHSPTTGTTFFVTGSSITTEAQGVNPAIIGFHPDKITGMTLDAIGPLAYVKIHGSASNDKTIPPSKQVAGGVGVHTAAFTPNSLNASEASGATVTLFTYEPNQSDFPFPIIETGSRTSGNTYSMSGTVNFGGENELHADILKDKTEYFYRSRIWTHAPIEWGTLDGMPSFMVPESGGTLLDSAWGMQYLNDIKYYGNYFMYMRTPKVAATRIIGLNGAQVAPEASITIKFDGVGDSDRLAVQFLEVAAAPSGNTSYSSITEAQWSGVNSTSINVPAKTGVGDDYIYTVQTTLEPDTYYWLRVKNFRNKLNMFGHNLEYFTSSEPKWFKTGGYRDSGYREGEIPMEPTLPTNSVNPTKGKPGGFAQSE